MIKIVKAGAVIAMASCLMAGTSFTSGAYAETLRVGVQAPDITNMDPARATTTQDLTVVSWMFNGLVRFTLGTADPSKIEPDTAESWTSSADDLTWTFKLRKDMKFHGDYGTLTADDVVFSLERAKNPETSAYASDYAAFKQSKPSIPQRFASFSANQSPVFSA